MIGMDVACLKKSRRLELAEARRLDLNIRHRRTGGVNSDRADGIVDQRQPDSGDLEAAAHDDDDQDKKKECLHRARMRRSVKRWGALRSGIDRA